MNPYRVLAAAVTGAAAVSLLSACSSTTGGSPVVSGVAHHASLASTPRVGVTPDQRGVVAVPTSAAPSSTPAGAPPSGPASTAPRTSTAPTVAPTPQGQPQITNFIGNWYGHGRSLVVDQYGTVTVDFRTYTFCGPGVTTACDRISGDTITDGGHVSGHITYVTNDTTVTVTVTSSTDPADFPVAPFRLGFDRGHDALAGFTGQFSGVPFCGDHAPAGYCGA